MASLHHEITLHFQKTPIENTEEKLKNKFIWMNLSNLWPDKNFFCKKFFFALLKIEVSFDNIFDHSLANDYQFEYKFQKVINYTSSEFLENFCQRVILSSCEPRKILPLQGIGRGRGLLIIKYRRIGVPTRDSLSSRIIKVCSLSRVEAELEN